MSATEQRLTNTPTPSANAAATGVCLADTPQDLSAIHHPDCAATIWRRNPLSSFQSWIDALEPERLPKARVTLRPHLVRKAAFEICETCGTPDCAERARLIDDAAALADLFAGLMQADYLQLRFDVIATNACSKFHKDAVTARLICTYRGTGTQYGISTNGAEPYPVFTVPTGAPLLLRGTLWPEHPSSGLLHRSPPIEGMDETRLVFVLDALADVENVSDGAFLH